eukprot:1927247-Rhodomonas_salina.1
MSSTDIRPACFVLCGPDAECSVLRSGLVVPACYGVFCTESSYGGTGGALRAAHLHCRPGLP